MKKMTRCLQMEEVRTERLDDCKHYRGCLSIAAYREWQGFSCAGCKTYEPTDQFQPDRLSRVCTPLAKEFGQ